jgi:hypothetical protein
VAEKFRTSENVVRYARDAIFGELVGGKEAVEIVEKKAREEIAELRQNLAEHDEMIGRILDWLRKIADIAGEHQVLFDTLRGYPPLSGLLPPRKEPENKEEASDRRVPRAA